MATWVGRRPLAAAALHTAVARDLALPALNSSARSASSPGDAAIRRMWWWYWGLVIANALDLLFTYIAAERGIEEGNILLQPILLTPWPAILKFSLLATLGIGLACVEARMRQEGRCRILPFIRAVTCVYLGVILFHLVGLRSIGN